MDLSLVKSSWLTGARIFFAKMMFPGMTKSLYRLKWMLGTSFYLMVLFLIKALKIHQAHQEWPMLFILKIKSRATQLKIGIIQTT